jgi:hypothetical protein
MANRKRRDPSRNFNFLVTFGALAGGVASLALFRKLRRKAEVVPPGVNVEESATAVRPIEGVGTSTAGLAGRSLKRHKRRGSAGRRR